jgi:hypothetical protein
MVPVPVDLRADVEHFLIMRDMALRTTQNALDEGAFNQLLAELNDVCTEVLSIGAAAAREDNDLSIRELADVLHRTVYETFGITTELCELTTRAVGPKVNIVSAVDRRRGSIDMDNKRLVVARDVAWILQEQKISETD